MRMIAHGALPLPVRAAVGALLWGLVAACRPEAPAAQSSEPARVEASAADTITPSAAAEGDSASRMKPASLAVSLGSERITLESTPLADVAARFAAEVFTRQRPGDHHHERVACVQVEGEGGPAVVELMTLPMSGANVASVLVRERTPGDARCAALPAAAGGVRLPLGLRLGMSQREVEAAAPGGRMDATTSEYVRERDRPWMLGDAPFTMSEWVRVKMRDGRAVEIELWEVNAS